MTRTNAPQTYDELALEATAAVERVERLPLGEPFASLVDAADAAVQALRSAVAAVLFPDSLQPVPSAALQDFAWCAETVWSGPADFPRELIRLHEVAYPELAVIVRSPRGRWRLIDALKSAAAVRGMSVADAVRLGLAEFETKIARQLAARGELIPESEILAAIIPALQARIHSARTSAESHAVSVIDGEQFDAAETDRVAARLFAERRDSVARRAGVFSWIEFEGGIGGLQMADRIRELESDDRLRLYEEAVTATEVRNEHARQRQASA
jgi:hypothetical protein